MYAVINTNKYTGVAREVSRHQAPQAAYEALEAMEFKRDAAIYEIVLDDDGDEDFEPIDWEQVFVRTAA